MADPKKSGVTPEQAKFNELMRGFLETEGKDIFSDFFKGLMEEHPPKQGEGFWDFLSLKK